MTKADLVERVRDQFLLGDQGESLTHETAECAVESVLHFMKRALGNHEEVVIRRFGRWKIQHKKERVGLNLKTLEHCVVSSRTVVKFKPGDTLRGVVNNS